MKKINDYYCYYYCSIVWASLLSVSVGCSYQPKNYMMDNPSSEQKGVVGQSSNSDSDEFDVTLKKVHSLCEAFKECCLFILEHGANYTLDNVTRIHHEFHSKQ